ncbi:MAG TPA: pilus assembly protein PilZ, partial [Candidatus Accumulibacter sp.]|nr:pilus assembly protein PilZ [Accumulibacter sp.]
MAETDIGKPAPAAAPPRPSVLSLNINSKSALYAAYMPLLRNGG